MIRERSENLWIVSRLPFGAIVFLFFQSVCGASPSAQLPAVTSAPATSELQNLTTAYQKEQQILNQQRISLLNQGSTPAQMAAWRKQNSPAFAVQLERAQAIAVISGMQVRVANRKANIPPGASQDLKVYLTAQAALANARASIHNQLVQQAQTSGKNLTFGDLVNLQTQEEKLFQQQNSSALAAQAQRSQTIASELAQKVQQVPCVIKVPPTATPQMAAYLKAQSQLRRAYVQLRNQYATASPSVREAALQSWRQQNATALAQLNTEAQALSQTPATSE